MGTNYYLEKDFCVCCGKPKTVVHLGKASAGWRFLFHKQKELNNIQDVKVLLLNGIVRDEYDTNMSPNLFLKMVEDKQKEKQHENAESIDGYDFLYAEFD